MYQNRNLQRKVYEEDVLIVEKDGEAISEINKKVVYATKEPEYIKLYLDCIMVLKGLKKGLSPMLIELTKYMSYADVNSLGGGQVIFLNKALKELIAKNLNVTIKRVEQGITLFVKTGILKRIAVSTYQVNPNIFGKGDWVNIKNIRATFDFRNKDAIAEIVKYEEETTTEQQTRLENEYNETTTA